MICKGFKMKLYDGMAEEYERRHNLLWPEMKEMIHQYGGSNYSIFIDKDTNTLFAYIELEDEEKWDESVDTAINRKWWDYRLISWRPIRTTAPYQSRSIWLFIWTDTVWNCRRDCTIKMSRMDTPISARFYL